MSCSLPERPSLRFLREQAKDLLKSHARGDADACPTLRLLTRFADADDAAILTADVALHDVQFALALDYGFAGWPAMVRHVEFLDAGAAAPGVEVDGDDPDVRLVLKGVPKIGYHRRLCPFPGSVEALLEYIGRPEPYDYLMGVSGAAFRRIWHPDDGGNVDLNYLQPEPHRRMFRAIGFGYRMLPVADRHGMIEAVKRSIADGKPVVAFGIIGPPEAGLVCGYDRGGDVLLGHDYFDFEKRPPEAPYYEKEDWYAAMRRHAPEFGEPGPIGMIVLGDPVPRPDPREMLRTSIEWAVDLARQTHRPNLPNHVCGLAAYDAWADALDDDAGYEADRSIDPPDPESPTAPRYTIETRAMVHGDQATMLVERAEAARFLRRMTEHAGPAAAALREAAGLYEQVGKADVWPWKAFHYMARSRPALPTATRGAGWRPPSARRGRRKGRPCGCSSKHWAAWPRRRRATGSPPSLSCRSLRILAPFRPFPATYR
jgi:hypothetical protein